MDGAAAGDLVSYIRPGDARHFSLINIAAENVPIEVMVVLAGHASASQNAHYAGNLGVYEKSPTHQAYFDTAGYMASLCPLTGCRAEARDGDPFTELDEGRCYSPAFQKGDVSDCVKSIGVDGELGWCPSCPYFRNSNPTLTVSDFCHLLKPVEDGWKLLQEMVDSYRMEFVGAKEEILRAILKLQTDECILKRYLERYIKGRYEGKRSPN